MQRSTALWERALDSLPGGNTRTTVFHEPQPVYIVRGEGCRVWDVDGAERMDFISNYTSLILGHCHPRVVEAVQRQAGELMSVAAPSELDDVEGSRALLHLDHVPRDVLLQRLGGDADAPRADEVLVLPAAVATDLPGLQVGDQRSVARPAVEQASETVDARPAVVRGSAALAPSNPISRSWVAARPPRRPTKGTRLLP